jgi:thiamine pyrophosphokinase
MARCIILANGILPHLAAARALLRPDDTLLAADGGMRHALALGLRPAAIIGDLDSATPEWKSMAEAGTEIVLHPKDKNETDLELALDYAVEGGHRAILILGALGGRLDQTLGNLSLLTNEAYRALDLRLDDGLEEAFFTRNQASLHGARGEVVSLIPWGGEVRGITTGGLRWSLTNETLLPYKTRGISNEMTGDLATITIESGLLLVVHRRSANVN